MVFAKINSTESITNENGELEIKHIIISMDKLDGTFKKCETNGKRFCLGSITIPKQSVAHINASVTATSNDASGVSDYSIFISKDKKGLNPYVACTGSDNPTESSVDITFIHKTGDEEEIIYLTGISGSNITVTPLQFSALLITKEYMG